MLSTRDLAAMGRTSYDLLVIGGGITGACIARDAALRGMSEALVERQDFSHATSAATSKLVHGGLRYLKSLEFSLVHESLVERQFWLSMAPHMVAPLPFLIPTWGVGAHNSLFIRAGLTLYDFMSRGHRETSDPHSVIPPHQAFSKKTALQMAPVLEDTPLSSAALYYDCQTYAPERLGLECILDAKANGAAIANYAHVTGLLRQGDTITGAEVEDKLGSERTKIKAAVTVNAAGPWADLLLDTLGSSPHARLIRSKGLHLITRSLNDTQAMMVPTNGTHFFVIPWRGHSIIGPTDTPHNQAPEAVCVSDEDIEELLRTINKGLPHAHLTRKDVVRTYVGLRPLIDTSDPEAEKKDAGTYRASRKAEVYDHEKTHDGLHVSGLISAMGGKWTTSRHVAEQVVDMAYAKLNREAPPCLTRQTPTYGGHVGRFAEFITAMTRQNPHIPPAQLTHLARLYGSRLEEVLALDTDGMAPLGRHVFDCAAQITYALRFEMAQTLMDVLFRRTACTALTHPGNAVIERAADIMGDALGWSTQEKTHQINTVHDAMALNHMVCKN